MKNIKLFEQFRGIESSILESFLDNLETEAPGALKTAEVIDPKEPPKETEVFGIWRKWLELQIRFSAIIGKVSDARGSKEEMLKIESEMKSIVSESTNWLNQQTSIEDLYKEGVKMKNSQIVWFLYSIKEDVGQLPEFGIKTMYDLIKER